MFEDKHNTDPDLLFRSILSDAEEEVPAHVWEGISDGLERIDRRRKVVLWWRRAAVGVAAAAAVAFVLTLNHGHEDNLVPEAVGSGMIAVVEPVKEAGTDLEAVVPDRIDERIADMSGLVAEVREKEADGTGLMSDVPDVGPAVSDVPSEVTMPDAGEEDAVEPVSANVSGNGNLAGDVAPESGYDAQWVDGEEYTDRKIKTSFTLSGLSGTNSVRSKARAGAIRFPTISKAPARTGISESSTTSTYGVPLSFGVGARFGFNEKWALGVGVNYSLLTRKFYGIYTHVNESGSIDDKVSSDIRNSQHYVGIPVNAFYTVVDRKNLNFYAYAGGTVEKCVSDRYQVLETSIVHREDVKGVQLSANIGIGVEFMLGRHLGLYIDPSLRYYFDCGQPKSIRTAQPLMLGFEMGLRASL